MKKEKSVIKMKHRLFQHKPMMGMSFSYYWGYLFGYKHPVSGRRFGGKVFYREMW